MAFRVEQSALTSSYAMELFPYIDTYASWGSEPIHVAARVIYHDRATQECPFKVRVSDKLSFEENCITISVVRDWFACDDLKKKGRAVAAAGALKKFNIDCKAFVCEDMRSGVIALSKNYETRLLISLFPQVTPWFFKGKPLSESEKQLLMATLTGDSDTFNRIVKEFVDSHHLESKIKVLQMNNFVSSLLENKLRVFKAKEERLLSEISDCEDRIRQKMAEYTEVCNTVLGIKGSHQNDEVKQFAEAFASNPNCFIDSISGGTVTFVATGFLTNFSRPAYEAVSKTTDSCLYEYASMNRISKTVLKAVLDEVVLGKRYRVNLSGKFKIDFLSNTVTLIRTYDAKQRDNAMPNPHISHYTCAGGFMARYNEAFRDGDYMEVLDIVFSEVQNINWTDYSPVSRFGQDLCGDYWKQPCVWDKVEKKFITPADLAAILEVRE